MSRQEKRSLSPSGLKLNFDSPIKKIRILAYSDRIVPEILSTSSSSNSSSPDGSSHEISSNIQHFPLENIGRRPKYGDIVDRCKLRKAGNYIIGPIVGSSPIDCLQQRLARKSGTNEFYTLKILTIDDEKKVADEARNMLQGKALLTTENFLLSQLKDMEGVIDAHEFFFDSVFEEKLKDKIDGKPLVHIYTGRVLKRIVLVLDCVYSHEFDRNSSAYMNLQQYVLRYKLGEWELLNIFKKVVEVVEHLHKRNIIHRDLKLNNVILNKITSKVTLINFCLGKLLPSETSTFNEKRGTPAYIAPELLTSKNYRGKPCDMWTLGVMLYTMVVGQFPFMDSAQPALFKKIKNAEFTFPPEKKITTETKLLIESLLCLKPEARFTASATIDTLNSIIQKKNRRHMDQIVPDIFDSDIDKKHQLRPSYDLSREQFSRKLENESNESRENKNFLRPNMLTLQRMRQQTTTGDSNVTFNLPDGRRTSLTHQIDNLSIHTHVHHDPSAWHTRINGSPAVKSLFLALNELFTRGRLPSPRETSEFTGYITQDLSGKISNFLRNNCRSQEIIREIFTPSRSDRSKVIELFRRFEIQMEEHNHLTFVKREQSLNNLMFLTFMMQISGYNNNYFLNMRN